MGTQQRNEDRAVFGSGPYRVRSGFDHLLVDDRERSQLDHRHRMDKLSLFLKAGMDGKKDLVGDEVQKKNRGKAS